MHRLFRLVREKREGVRPVAAESVDGSLDLECVAPVKVQAS